MFRQPIKSKRPQKQEILRQEAIPAPVYGWNTKNSQAAMDPRYALYLDNWWPTAKTVDTRMGASDWVTGIPSTVKTMLGWNGPTSSHMFACTDTAIYDVTSTGVVGASVKTITNGRVESVNFTGTGGSFLICVNGTDDLFYYNGAAWATVASFTIGAGPSTLLSKDISNIQSFKRGLFFIKKDSLSFFYLPIDQITGSVSEFPLGALFSKGGYLVAQGNWTVDGGKGVDDLTAFVTSEGQVALYQGTDPSSTTTWGLVGVFDIAKPLGKRCFTKFGGDLLLLSHMGCVGLSKYLQSTKINFQPAITDNIVQAFSDAASLYGDNNGWEFAISPKDRMLLVNIPVTEYGTSYQYVMNTDTGAWARFTGWNSYCFIVFNNETYMGMGGKIGKAWQPGGDFGGIIQCYAKQAYVYLPPRGRPSQISMLQPILKIGGRVAVDAAIDNDFADNEDYGAATFNNITNSRFDTARFDTAVWGQVATTRVDWLTVADEMGSAKAIRLRVLSSDATVEWSATNLLYESGALQG